VQLHLCCGKFQDAAALTDVMGGRDDSDCTTYTSQQNTQSNSLLDAVRQATTASLAGVRIALLDLEEVTWSVD
jgi:hypothetical protein